MADDNPTLHELFVRDQADRRDVTTSDWPTIRGADQQRRALVEALLTTDQVRTAADQYHAAMVLQHGERLEDHWRTHELATRAADLGHGQGRWLAAAAYDRWLMMQGKPQKYGTQYHKSGDGYVLWDVDPETTDAERAEWDVPPLEVSRRIGGRLGMQADPTDAFLEDPPIAALEVPGLRVEINAGSVHRRPRTDRNRGPVHLMPPTQCGR